MYEEEPDKSALRQGDILCGLFIPRLKLADVLFFQRLSDSGKFEPENQAVFDAEPKPAVVISQCCEFNEGKRASFSLAPLQHIREWLKPESKHWGFSLAELVPIKKSAWKAGLDGLRLSNKIDLKKTENKSVNTYLFEADGTHLAEPHVLDFTRVVSFRMLDRKVALRAKVLQLDNVHRREFQLKLGYFYSRQAR